MRQRTTSLLTTAALVGAGLIPAALLTAAPAHAAAGCTVDYSIASQWPGGFQGAVTVTNTGDPINSWEITWNEPAGQSIAQAWNATVSPNRKHRDSR